MRENPVCELELEAQRHERVAERFELLDEPERAREARRRAAECRARRHRRQRLTATPAVSHAPALVSAGPNASENDDPVAATLALLDSVVNSVLQLGLDLHIAAQRLDGEAAHHLLSFADDLDVLLRRVRQHAAELIASTIRD